MAQRREKPNLRGTYGQVRILRDSVCKIYSTIRDPEDDHDSEKPWGTMALWYRYDLTYAQRLRDCGAPTLSWAYGGAIAASSPSSPSSPSEQGNVQTEFDLWVEKRIQALLAKTGSEDAHILSSPIQMTSTYSAAERDNDVDFIHVWRWAHDTASRHAHVTSSLADTSSNNDSNNNDGELLTDVCTVFALRKSPYVNTAFWLETLALCASQSQKCSLEDARPPLQLKNVDLGQHCIELQRMESNLKQWYDDKWRAGAPARPHIHNLADFYSLALDLSESLYMVHSAGWIHQDIKPANVLTSGYDSNGSERRAVLCDFSIACLRTEHAQRKISLTAPAYRSPEQFAYCGYTQSADIWSLAATLFEYWCPAYLVCDYLYQIQTWSSVLQGSQKMRKRNSRHKATHPHLVDQADRRTVFKKPSVTSSVIRWHADDSTTPPILRSAKEDEAEWQDQLSAWRLAYRRHPAAPRMTMKETLELLASHATNSVDIRALVYDEICRLHLHHLPAMLHAFVPDVSVRRLLATMLDIRPDRRPLAEQVMNQCRDTLLQLSKTENLHDLDMAWPTEVSVARNMWFMRVPAIVAPPQNSTQLLAGKDPTVTLMSTADALEQTAPIITPLDNSWSMYRWYCQQHDPCDNETDKVWSMRGNLMIASSHMGRTMQTLHTVAVQMTALVLFWVLNRTLHYASVLLWPLVHIMIWPWFRPVVISLKRVIPNRSGSDPPVKPTSAIPRRYAHPTTLQYSHLQKDNQLAAWYARLLHLSVVLPMSNMRAFQTVGRTFSDLEIQPSANLYDRLMASPYAFCQQTRYWVSELVRSTTARLSHGSTEGRWTRDHAALFDVLWTPLLNDHIPNLISDIQRIFHYAVAQGSGNAVSEPSLMTSAKTRAERALASTSDLLHWDFLSSLATGFALITYNSNALSTEPTQRSPGRFSAMHRERHPIVTHLVTAVLKKDAHTERRHANTDVSFAERQLVLAFLATSYLLGTIRVVSILLDSAPMTSIALQRLCTLEKQVKKTSSRRRMRALLLQRAIDCSTFDIVQWVTAAFYKSKYKL